MGLSVSEMSRLSWLRNCTAENDSFREWRALPVRDDHVGLAALGHSAQVHVHEGLALIGPVRDFDHFPLIGEVAEVRARVHDLVIHQEVKVANVPEFGRDFGLGNRHLNFRDEVLGVLAAFPDLEHNRLSKAIGSGQLILTGVWCEYERVGRGSRGRNRLQRSSWLEHAIKNTLVLLHAIKFRFCVLKRPRTTPAGMSY